MLPSDAQMNGPFISIIIPARNAQATLKLCLDSIFNLQYQNYEVIVINDGSTDATDRILAQYHNIKVLKTTGEGPGKARNLGLKDARGEFVAFTDADCIVDADWLRELIKGFTEDKVAGVGGTQKSPADEFRFGKAVHEFLTIFGFIADYMKHGTKIKITNHNPSCNVMYRKSILLELGGFLEGLWPGEDVELDYRLKKKNYSLIFNPQAIVYHYRPRNFADYSRMMFRYGKVQGALVRKYGFFRIIHYVPLFIFILLLTFMYNFLLGFLFLTLIFTSLVIKLSIRSKDPLLMSQFFIATIFNWNLGFLLGLFKRRSIG